MNELPEPDSLVGLARQASKLFPLPATTDPNYPAEIFQRDQALHQWIREQFHVSVIAHEMGHSMGLRHNFTGSFDALNYHTEYWQLRTRNGAEHYCGFPGALDATTPHTNGDRLRRPALGRPRHRPGGQRPHLEVGLDHGHGLPGRPDPGHERHRLVRQGGDALRLREHRRRRERQARHTSALRTARPRATGVDYLRQLDGFGGIFGQFVGGNHYSTYNDKYGILGTCTARPDGPGPERPARDAVLRARPRLRRRARHEVTSIKFGAGDHRRRTPSTCRELRGRPAGPRAPPVHVRVATSSRTSATCPVFRFDAGADSYEQMQFLISTYENRYIFNNFRRNRVTFDTGAVVARTEQRYFDKIQQITKSLALGVELETAPGADPHDESRAASCRWRSRSADGFAMFARALTRPGPGPYVVTPPSAGGPPNPWGRTWQLGDPTSPNAPPSSLVNVALGNGEGRFLHNDYDYTKGYWWSEYQTQVGSYYEKADAFAYLLEAYNDFVSNQQRTTSTAATRT